MRNNRYLYLCCTCVCILSCSVVFDSSPPPCQTTLSAGLSRQKYWSGLPFPTPGIFPTQKSNPRPLHLLHSQVGSLPLCHLRSPPFPFSSVQLLSRVQLFVTPWIAARQASLSITNPRSSPKPMSIESVMPSNHLILCRPLLLLPSVFPSIKWVSSSHQVSKALEFQLQHQAFHWTPRTDLL